MSRASVVLKHKFGHKCLAARQEDNAISDSHQPDKVHLFTCETCCDTTDAKSDGLGGGAKLSRVIKSYLAEPPYRDRLVASDVRCLMACTEGCVLSIGQRGKFKYLIGRLSDDPRVIEQVLDFAVLYGETRMGVMPNHEWPPLLALHLLARIPPCEPRDPAWTDSGAHL